MPSYAGILNSVEMSFETAAGFLPGSPWSSILSMKSNVLPSVTWVPFS